MKFIHALILTIIVGCGTDTHPAFAGDYIPVRLYLAQHPDGLTACQVQEAWNYAQAEFDRAGVPVKLAAFTEISDFPYKNFDDPRYQYERLTAAKAWLRTHGVDTSCEEAHDKALSAKF
jgi:hypothetical protein